MYRSGAGVLGGEDADLCAAAVREDILTKRTISGLEMTFTNISSNLTHKTYLLLPRARQVASLSSLASSPQLSSGSLDVAVSWSLDFLQTHSDIKGTVSVPRNDMDNN